MPDDLERQLDEMLSLARQAYDEERYPSVVELLSVYVDYRPDDFLACRLLARALQKVHLIHEAERVLQRAAELKPGDWRVRVDLAGVCEDTGRLEEAEILYALALENEKDAAPGWIWIKRGVNLLTQSLLTAAEACLRRAIDSDDVDVDEAYLNLGCVLVAQGRYAEARDAFEQSREFDPDVPNAGWGISSLGGIEEAINIAKVLKHRYPLKGAEGGPTT